MFLIFYPKCKIWRVNALSPSITKDPLLGPKNMDCSTSCKLQGPEYFGIEEDMVVHYNIYINIYTCVCARVREMA